MNCSALLPSVKVWRTQLVKLRFMLLCIWVTHVYAIVSNTAHLLTKGNTGVKKFVTLDTVLIFVFELYFMALIKNFDFEVNFRYSFLTIHRNTVFKCTFSQFDMIFWTTRFFCHFTSLCNLTDFFGQFGLTNK